MLPAANAEWIWTGSTVTLKRTAIVAATPGSWLWTGADVTLTYVPSGGGFAGSSEDLTTLVASWLPTLTGDDKTIAWQLQIPSIRTGPQALDEDLNTDTKVFLDND